MARVGKAPIFVVAMVFSIGVIPAYLRAQSPEEIRQAFIDLHDDKVPHNCDDATEWLFKYRGELKKDLLEELYKTDWQGRAVIRHLLFDTPSFTPDDRFIGFIVASLAESESASKDWKFIDGHYAQFEPSLRESLVKTVGRSHVMYVLWCTTWMAKKHTLLEQYLPLCTNEVLQMAATNLKNDSQRYNASQAVRFFLLIADKGLPTLRETTHSSDTQAASLARALIEALGGSHDAFGFLGSKCTLEYAPVGSGIQPPEWYNRVVLKYAEQEKYP